MHSVVFVLENLKITELLEVFVNPIRKLLAVVFKNGRIFFVTRTVSRETFSNFIYIFHHVLSLYSPSYNVLAQKMHVSGAFIIAKGCGV